MCNCKGSVFTDKIYQSSFTYKPYVLSVILMHSFLKKIVIPGNNFEHKYAYLVQI